MEATELLKTLETAAGNLRKFLESAENKSGEKAAEDYVKEHELEYIFQKEDHQSPEIDGRTKAVKNPEETNGKEAERN